jgi:hypothetical protein
MTGLAPVDIFTANSDVMTYFPGLVIVIVPLVLEKPLARIWVSNPTLFAVVVPPLV